MDDELGWMGKGVGMGWMYDEAGEWVGMDV